MANAPAFGGWPGPYSYEPCLDVDPMPAYENVLTDFSASRRSMKFSTRRLAFELSIGFVHPGGFMLGWFMGQMMEPGFRPFGCAS